MDRRHFLKMMGGVGAAAATYGFSPLLSPCLGKQQRTPRLVLLYATCTLNKSCLSPYNQDVTYTPHLEKFAADAAVFEACQAESGQSGIAYASIFSGYQADQHGIFSQPSRIDDSVFLITEAFASNGYDVFFWGGHPMADYRLNYGQGTPRRQAFPYQLLAADPTLNMILKRLAADENYRACLVTTFSVTHEPYYPAFPPYPSLPFGNLPDRENHKFYSLKSLPTEFAELEMGKNELKNHYRLYLENYQALMLDFKKTVAKLELTGEQIRKLIETITYTYKLNISRLDNLFGEVVTRIKRYGLFDDSLILFTADHGETLFRDNTFFKFTHGFQLAPEVLSVPLIISAPGAGIKPSRYPQVVRSTDIAPTLSGLCGFSLPQKAAGLDLGDILTGTEDIPELPAWSHTALPPAQGVLDEIINFFIDRRHHISSKQLNRLYPEHTPEMMWVAVRHKDLLYKIAKLDSQAPEFKPALFDLAIDPEERNNLFDPDNERHRQVNNDLEKYKQRLVKKYHNNKENRESGDIDKKERIRRLRALGYL